jgi:hypothetical protein
MDKKLKEKWIAALESGKYEQGIYALRNDTELGGYAHCCLGVLCDVVNPEGWCDPIHNIPGVYDHALGETWLNQDALDDLGLLQKDAFNLMQLNDTSVDFDEAIKYLRNNEI